MLVLQAKINNRMDERQFSHYLRLLAPADVCKIQGFKRWQDAHLCIYGRILLMQGLLEMGYSNTLIQQMRFGKYRKPFFENGPFFNISHAGSTVVCVISDNIKVGIDIEAIIEVNINDFKSQFNQREWNDICLSTDSIYKFYHYWTRKEAVIKADGQGLNIPLKLIDVSADTIKLSSTIWRFTEVVISPGYTCHLAFESQPIEDLKILTNCINE